MDSGLRQPAAGAPYQGPYQSCDGGQRRPAPTADAARRSLSPGADHQRCGAAQPLSAVELVLPAGWRVAGGLPSSRALCLGGPHAPRQPLRERVDASTCLQLEWTAAEAGPEAEPPPALIVRASAGQPLAVAAITLLSEFGQCQLFGEHGEYLSTEMAELVEEAEGTEVRELRHQCQPPSSQLTIQCVRPSGRRQLWVFAVEVTLAPRPSPPAAFSLDRVLQRVGAAPLSEGAAALKSALQTNPQSSTPAAAALAALLFNSSRPADTGGGLTPSGETENLQLEKLSLEGAECSNASGAGEGSKAAAMPEMLGAALNAGLNDLEERLWRRIHPRLDAIDRKQNDILEKLDRLISGKQS